MLDADDTRTCPDTAAAWTRAARSIADIDDMANWPSTAVNALIAVATHFETRSLLPRPLIRTPDWASSKVITALAASAHRSLAAAGYAHNGKLNAPVSERATALVSKIGIPSYAERETGIPFTAELSLTYVAYNTPQASLGLHVDTREYGDVNLLICLEKAAARSEVDSSTVFITSHGIERHPLNPGQCLIFDGPSTLHGRTPVREGESIILLNVGLSRAAPSESPPR